MSYLKTYSGNKIFLGIGGENIHLMEDIAHQLSHTNRFSGATQQAYSVAQHSVLVSRLLPADLKMAGLLHDASEYVLCDLPRPIKELPCMASYKALEETMTAEIFQQFGVRRELIDHFLIKEADLTLLATERRDLLCERTREPWDCLAGIQPLPQIIKPWPADVAKDFFLEAFNKIKATDKARMGVPKVC